MAQERRAIAEQVSALHAHPNELRDGAEMLCMPLGAGSAHVMLLRPVGIEQGPNEVVNEIAKIGKHARRLVAGGPGPDPPVASARAGSDLVRRHHRTKFVKKK